MIDIHIKCKFKNSLGTNFPSIFLDNIACFAIISLHNRDFEVLTFLMHAILYSIRVRFATILSSRPRARVCISIYLLQHGRSVYITFSLTSYIKVPCMQVFLTFELEIHVCSNHRLYFQLLCQHEVFRHISILNAGSLCSRHVNYGNMMIFFLFFLEKKALNS